MEVPFARRALVVLQLVLEVMVAASRFAQPQNDYYPFFSGFSLIFLLIWLILEVILLLVLLRGLRLVVVLVVVASAAQARACVRSIFLSRPHAWGMPPT